MSRNFPHKYTFLAPNMSNRALKSNPLSSAGLVNSSYCFMGSSLNPGGAESTFLRISPPLMEDSTSVFSIFSSVETKLFEMHR